jgi:hypothetical protein
MATSLTSATGDVNSKSAVVLCCEALHFLSLGVRVFYHLIEVGYNELTSGPFLYSGVLPDYAEQNPSREVNVH